MGMSIKDGVYDAPAIAARVVEFQNGGNLAPYCVVENLSDLASAPVCFQESADGQVWSDIPNTKRTVLPGSSDGQIVTSSQPYIALNVGGNLQIKFTVVRQVNGSPVNLGTP